MYREFTGDATRIAARLWQGSKPACFTPLNESGFDVLVLAAKEHQPPSGCFPGVRVFHVKLDDSGPPPTRNDLIAAHQTAKEVSALWRRGARVLVTCAMGVNRSGLITALVLRDALGISGKEARRVVQAARVVDTPHGPLRALCNKDFAAHLDSLAAKPAPRWDLRGTGGLLPPRVIVPSSSVAYG